MRLLRFLQEQKLIDEIQDGEWVAFAAGYNGSGKAAEYGQKIADAYEVARDLPIPAAGTTRSLPPVAATPTLVGDGGTPALPGAEDGYMADFIAMVGGLSLRNFKPYELLVLGHQHVDPDSPAFGLNHVPPREIWPNITLTIKVLDELRDVLAAPIVISSAYRSPPTTPPSPALAAASTCSSTRWTSASGPPRALPIGPVS